MIQYSDVLFAILPKEGKLMSRNIEYFTRILGNEALKHRLSKDVTEGSLSHAYILEGPRGSGRHTMALNLAAAIECEEKESVGSPNLFGETEACEIPCGRCINCEKILGGKSPDIIVVGLEEDRSTLGVETIRNLKNDMYTAPNDLSVKVYIIEDADLMTIQAQNAFLLSLEEPPSYILFFLICENSANLLETVRSRAPTLRMRRLREDDIEKHLLENDDRAESPADWRSLLAVCGGSLGYAIELLEPKARSNVFEYRNSAKSLISMLSRSNKLGALEAVNEFGTKRVEVINRLSF